MGKRIFNSLILILFVSGSIWAQYPRYFQDEKNNDGTVLTVNLLFGGHTPAGDFADRYGWHSSIGGGIDLMTPKDWILGVQTHFMFGNQVKEDVLSQLRNEDGLIFGTDGGISEILLRQRGIYMGGHIGKLIRIKSTHRSGIRITAGAGMFQHKIRIQDDPIVDTPQLSREYKKGYDRLSNGLGITQFIGYQHLGRLRRVNFLAGFEFTQAFTQNRRSFNFDTREADTESRFDLSIGFRMGWQLPLYIAENADELQY